MSYLVYVILIILLLIISVQDIRKKEVSVIWIVAIGVIAGINALYRIVIAGDSILELLFQITPGIMLIGITLIAEDSIGMADGIIVLFIGSILKLKEAIIALLMMSFLLMIISIVMLIIKKANRKTKIAMLPFITAGTIVSIVFGRGFN